jgi:thiamine transport system substrate-binding protein
MAGFAFACIAFTLCALAVSAARAETLTILTHNSFAISKAVLADFTQQTGIQLKFIQGGDAGATLNRAILTKDHPLADVLFGVDNDLIARARQADLFEPYQSPLLADVPQRYIFAKDGYVTPIDVGFVTFVFDKSYFKEHKLAAPENLKALTEPAYKNLTVVENPAISSPGLAFMLLTIAKFGQGNPTWLDYWAALRDNGLKVVDGWNAAYYTDFSHYGGDRPIVLSYATDPAAEVYFAKSKLSASPVGALLCQQCAYEQIEGAAILKGTKHRAAAETFINFMLSERFQEDIPLNMFVYPVNRKAELPAVFKKYAPVPDKAQTAPPVTDSAKLKSWLLAWSRVVEQGQKPPQSRR